MWNWLLNLMFDDDVSLKIKVFWISMMDGGWYVTRFVFLSWKWFESSSRFMAFYSWYILLFCRYRSDCSVLNCNIALWDMAYVNPCWMIQDLRIRIILCWNSFMIYFFAERISFNNPSTCMRYFFKRLRLCETLFRFLSLLID